MARNSRLHSGSCELKIAEVRVKIASGDPQPRELKISALNDLVKRSSIADAGGWGCAIGRPSGVKNQPCIISRINRWKTVLGNHSPLVVCGLRRIVIYGVGGFGK